MTIVDGIVDKVTKDPTMPKPKSIKRKGHWSDTDGEVDVDRAMKGEPDMYRLVKRERVAGPTSVALVANVDCPGMVNKTGLFYRSMAAIALTDILENLGYSVELWMWCLGGGVYPRPHDKQFTACCMKQAGDPVDKSALCDTLSAWFCSEGIFGTFPIVANCQGYGYAMEGEDNAKTLKDSGLRGWERHLDISQNVMAVPVPAVYGSVDNAAKCTRTVLTNIINRQEQGEF